MTPAPLFTPAAFTGAMALLAAFGCGLYFGGYQDIIFAPAIGALLVFALLALLPLCWRGFNLPATPVAALTAAFWFFITLSLGWSNVPFASIVTYLIALVLPLTFFALTLARDRTAWLSLCGGMLMMGLLVLAGWAVVQSVFLPDLFYRAHDPLPNPNSLAALLNLGLFAMVPAFMARRDTDINSWLALAAAGLLFAGVVATESRGALLATLVAMPVLIAMLGTGWRRALLLLGMLMAVYGAMHMTTGGEMTRRIAQVNDTASGEETLSSRRAIWSSAMEMAMERPLTGSGLGTFYLYYPAHRTPLADNSAGNWVHNDPLQFAVEMGVLAPLLLYAVMLAALARTIRALPRTRRGSWERAAIAAPFCALITFAIDAHLSFPFYIMPITICAGVLMAVWYDATARAFNEPERPVTFTGWQRPFMVVATLAVAGLIATMAGSSAAGMHYLQKAKVAMATGDVENFVLLADKATRFGPPSFIDPQVMVAGLYIDSLVPPGGVMTMAEQSQARTDALHLLDEAQSVNPAWAEIDYKRGRLYAVTGAYGLTPDGTAQAAEQYRIALSKNPMHYRAREELAKIMAERGDTSGAFDLLQQGMQYPMPNAITATYLPLMHQLAGFAATQKQLRDRKTEE